MTYLDRPILRSNQRPIMHPSHHYSQRPIQRPAQYRPILLASSPEQSRPAAAAEKVVSQRPIVARPPPIIYQKPTPVTQPRLDPTGFYGSSRYEKQPPPRYDPPAPPPPVLPIPLVPPSTVSRQREKSRCSEPKLSESPPHPVTSDVFDPMIYDEEPPARQWPKPASIASPDEPPAREWDEPALLSSHEEMPAARKWHKPASLSSSESTTSEDESDTSVFMNKPIKRKDAKRIHIIECSSSSSSSSSTPALKKRKTTAHSSVETEEEVDKTKRKMDTSIPTKAEAIEGMRQLGKFIKAWTQKDPEVCCVCFEDVTTELNPLVYCDNALCEVIVHKNCYKIRTNISESSHWYCDRCKTTNGEACYKNVV